MKRILTILGLLALLTTGISCKKKVTQPELPPATTTGANTFGCYVDGVPYAIFDGNPKDWDNISTELFENYNYGTVKISAAVVPEPRWWFDIGFKNSNNITGEFESGEYPYYSSIKIKDNNGSMPTSSNLFETNRKHTLKVTITKAIKGVQYSGTFYGEMVNEEGKVIQITDGRFDVKK